MGNTVMYKAQLNNIPLSTLDIISDIILENTAKELTILLCSLSVGNASGGSWWGISLVSMQSTQVL